MSLESHIAWRYLKEKDKPFMSQLLAAVAIFGIALGVFAFLLIQSAMLGFSSDLREKVLRFSPPLILKPLAEEFLNGKKPPPLRDQSQIMEISPYLESAAILQTEDDLVQGVKLKGIETSQSSFLERLHPEFVEGYSKEDFLSEEELPGILLGTELAKRLNLLPFLTEKVELIYPLGEVDPTGEMRPKTRSFKVIGTFKSGYYEADHKFVVVGLSQARRLIPTEEVPTSWGVWPKDFFQSGRVAASLSELLKGKFKVEKWGDRNQKLFKALQLERISMFMVLMMMLMIAAFNLFSLTMMFTVAKEKEIAIFQAIGLSRSRIRKVFCHVGFLLGLMGTGLGFFLALGVISYLRLKPLKLPSSYYLENLPLQINFYFFLAVLLLAPLFALLASWYPAYKASRVEISQNLRYE